MKKKEGQKIIGDAQPLKVVKQQKLFAAISTWGNQNNYPTLSLHSGETLQKAAIFGEIGGQEIHLVWQNITSFKNHILIKAW